MGVHSTLFLSTVSVLTYRCQTYVLKAHVLAGHPAPIEGVDYACLTREEIEQRRSEEGGADAKAYTSIVMDLLDA